MKVSKLFAMMIALGALHTAHADILAAKGSVEFWNYSADLSHPRDTNIHSPLHDDHAFSFSVALEHPVPLLPNLKIKHTNLQAESDEHLSGVQRNQIDLNQSDFILYYEILDNIIDLDAGFGLKHLEGDIRYHFTNTQDIGTDLPMLYAQAGLNLPFTGLSANTEISMAGLNDAKITDVQAELKYNFIDSILVDVGATLGYRILDIQLEQDHPQEVKMKFKGPYLGLEAHF